MRCRVAVGPIQLCSIVQHHAILVEIDVPDNGGVGQGDGFGERIVTVRILNIIKINGKGKSVSGDGTMGCQKGIVNRTDCA